MARAVGMVFLLTVTLLSGCLTQQEPALGVDSGQGRDDSLRSVLDVSDSNSSYAHQWRITKLVESSVFASMDWTWDMDDFSAVYAWVRYDDGTVDALLHGYEFDGRHVGTSDRLATIGTPTGNVNGPGGVDGSETRVNASFSRDLPAGTYDLIVAWTGVERGVRIDFDFGRAVRVHDEGTIPVTAFTDQDLQNGYHATTPAASAHFRDGASLGGDATLLDLRVYVADAGTGSIAITGPATDYDLSLDGTQYADDSCVACYQDVRVLATDESLHVGMDLQAGSQQFRLYGIAVHPLEPASEAWLEAVRVEP